MHSRRSEYEVKEISPWWNSQTRAGKRAEQLTAEHPYSGTSTGGIIG